MARWTDLATWRGPIANQGGAMVEVRGVVLHIAEGSYEGTIAWQRNPTSDVSSHFVAAKDGRASQMVDTAITAWTQKAGNGHWLSIENEGFVPDRLTARQIEFAAQILVRAHTVYRVPLQVTNDPDGRGLGHHSMGAHPGYPDDWGHPGCPGANIIAQKPTIVARAKEILEEQNMPTPEEYAKAVWNCDQIPAPRPPVDNPDYATNKTWQADNALSATVEQSRKNALAIGELSAKLDRIIAALEEGVTVSPVVKVDPESVAEIADATADEIYADPERDGV
jgi:hypothetical protein